MIGRRSINFFLVFLLCFSINIFKTGGWVESADVTSEVEKNLRMADTYITSRDYNSARKEYLKIKEYKDLNYATQLSLFNIAETYRLEKKYSLAHQTYNEILKIPNLSLNYRIYSLFIQANLYIEEKNYISARKIYSDIVKTEGVSQNQIFKAEMYIGDTYRLERKYQKAEDVYELLLRQEEANKNLNENHRLDLVDRLENIEGLKEGEIEKSIREKRVERVNSPKYHIYVSLKGRDTNKGTKTSPFQTIKRAQAEIQSIKKTTGMPQGGITVYLRGGKYFITEGLRFNEEDSGEEGAPIVYRSFPGEEVRIIGGKQVTNFKPLKDPKIIRQLPKEVKTKVWVSDLKEVGINDYGNLLNRGQQYNVERNGAMELFFDTKPMSLAYWPDEGWCKTRLKTQGGAGYHARDILPQQGSFQYIEDRPNRWKEEKEIWITGYFNQPWQRVHTKVTEINFEEKTLFLAPDVRFLKANPHYGIPIYNNVPYKFYNLLSEISMPGEFYVDREEGKLYFYPPDIIEGREIIVSILDEALLTLNETTNIIFNGLTFEGGWRNGISINGGNDNLIAGCKVRNVGQYGLSLEKGWRNGVVGCDICDVGEGGVRVDGGNWKKLIPSRHYVENNHITRFNRFDGGYRPAVRLFGIGNRVSHNLISDSSHQAILMDYNNHIVEYNEIYDVVSEARDAGVIYIYGEPRYLMNRGNILRYNFLHHITEHSSEVPYPNPGINGIYIDALNAGQTIVGNIIYRCTGTGVFTHGSDSRIEDNIFVDNNTSLIFGNRIYVLKTTERVKYWKNNILSNIKYRQPPWSVMYPQLRNINIGGKFMNINDDLYSGNFIGNNIDSFTPFFINPETLDFTIRAGSPVYGNIEHNSIPFEDIGLYKDELRVTWPVKKSPAGKYYKPEWQTPVEDVASKFPTLARVSREQEYEVVKRVNPIKIDGTLNKEEWFGLDKNRAISVMEEHQKGIKREKSGSYLWITYDEENIYLGIESLPDRWKEGLPKEISYAAHEFTIEGAVGKDAWWQEGVPTGPLYVFTGKPDGKFVVHNLFNIPTDIISNIKKQVEYKSVVIDKETSHWTAEWRLPLSILNIELKDNKTCRFNIGSSMRDGWYAWVATGAHIWRVDNAGVIKFK